MSGNCIFKDIEGIGICDGGTPIEVTKIASDDVEVAIHQDDSCGAPNTVSRWHEVVYGVDGVDGVVVTPFLYHEANHNYDKDLLYRKKSLNLTEISNSCPNFKFMS